MTNQDSTDPVEDIISEFHRLPIPDRPADDELLGHLKSHLNEIRPATVRTNHIRSYLMKPIFRYLCVFLFAVGFMYWMGHRSPNWVALGQAIAATEQHSLVRFKGTVTPDVENHSDENSIQRSIFYVDLRSHRMRQESTHKKMNGSIEGKRVIITNEGQDRITHMESYKVVGEVADLRKQLAPQQMPDMPVNMQEMELKGILDACEDGREAKFATVSNSPRKALFGTTLLLDAVRELQRNSETTATNTELDGHQAIAFRLENKPFIVTFPVATTVWIDAKTHLPLRIVQETIDPNHKSPTSEAIYSDFEWDPVLDGVDKLFDTTPPDNFIVNEIYPDGSSGPPRRVK